MTLGGSDVVAANLRKARKRRGWSTRELAAQCLQTGAPHLTASVLANIESGRPGADGVRTRQVTVDELLTLAYVLDVAPTYLLLPSQGADSKVALTESVDVTDSVALGCWLRGERPLPGADEAAFLSGALDHAPVGEAQRTLTSFARAVLVEEAQRLISQWRPTTDEIAERAREMAARILDDVASTIQDDESAAAVRVRLRAARDGIAQASPEARHR